MARSLSWIDNDELSALFDVVGPKRGQPAAQPAPAAGKDSWSELGARRPVAPRPVAPRPVASRPAPPVAPRSVTARPVMPPAAVPPAAAKAPVAAQAPAVAAQAQAPAVAAQAQAPAVAAQAQAPAVAAQAQAPAVAKVEPFRPEQGADLAARMEQFFDWVLAQAPVQGVVIADDQGLVVARREAGDLEASLAISLEQLFGRVSNLFAEDPADKADVTGHVVLRHVTKSRERLLITVWTPTDYGRYYGVLLGQSVPGADVLELAGQGLETVFAG